VIAKDPDRIDDVTSYLAIDEQPDDDLKPYKARISSSLEDTGVLSIATPVTATVESSHPPSTSSQKPKGAQRWQEQRARATERRRAIVDDQANDLRAAEAKAAHTRTIARQRAAQQAAAGKEWQQTPFNLGLLEEWIALDEAIEHQAEAIHDESVRNVEQERTFEKQRRQELEAIAEGISELENDPNRFEREAEKSKADRSIVSQIASSLRMSSNGRLRVENPQAAVQSRSTAEELARLRRQVESVEAEVFRPARQESKRLETLRKKREKTIVEFGRQVLASNRPAVTRTTTGDPKPAKYRNRTADIDIARDKRKFRIAAHVVRGSYPDGLSLEGDAFEGIRPERLQDPAFVDNILRPLVADQKALGIKEFTGITADVASECKSLTNTSGRVAG
jgi:hypothetical protein